VDPADELPATPQALMDPLAALPPSPGLKEEKKN